MRARLLLALLLPVSFLAQEKPEDGELDAAQRLHLANRMFQAEIYSQARDEYRQFLREFGTHENAPAAYLMLAATYRKLEAPETALATYEALRRRYPDTPQADRAVVQLAAMFLEQEKLERAEKLLGKLDFADVEEASAEGLRYYRGALRLRTGNLSAAAEDLKPLAQAPMRAERPYRAHARLYLARIWREKRTEDAVKLLRGLAAAEAAPADLREQAAYQVGQLYYEAGQYAAAAKAYRSALQAFPGSPRAPHARLQRAWSLFSLAQEQDGTEARELYDQVLAVFDEAGAEAMPEVEEKLYLRARSLQARELLARAAATYRELLKKYPDGTYVPYAEMGLLRCLYDQHEYDRVAALAKELPERDEPPHFTRTVRALWANSEIGRENYAAAVEILQGLLEMELEAPRRRTTLWQLAEAYEALNKPAEAAAVYRQVAPLAEGAEGVEAWLKVGHRALAAGDTTLALEGFRQARESEASEQNQRAEARLGEVVALIRQEEHKQAIDRLTAFLKVFPDHPKRSQAHYYRGWLYLHMKDLDNAVADLRACLQGPDFADRDAARLLLAYALWDRDTRAAEREALELFAELLREPGPISSRIAPELLNAIGERYLRRNNLQAAEHAYQRMAAAEDKPDVHLAGHVGLGKVAFAREELEAAIERFNGAIEKAARMDETRYRAVALAHRGEAYRRMDKVDLATMDLRTALKLLRDHRGMAEAKSLANLGMARILAERGEVKAARSYAVAAYVLVDHSVFSPQAILLHMQLLLRSGHQGDARAAYRTLDKKYGSQIPDFRRDPRYKALFEELDALRKEAQSAEAP